MPGEIVNIEDLLLEEEETGTSKDEIVSVDDLDFESGNQTDSSIETSTTESNVTGSGSDAGSSVFKGTGWGKPTKFIDTGIPQDEGRGTYKAEQTSTFENIPGAIEFPKINNKLFENKDYDKIVDFYNKKQRFF